MRTTMKAMQNFRSPFSLFTVPLLFSFLGSTAASCECGYLVDTTASNSTSTGNATLFTTILETDFLHLSSLADTHDWIPQSYTASPTLAHGLYGKNASLSNMIANPLNSAYDWAGLGANDSGAGGLQLYVRSGAATPVGGLIGISEIATTRRDILYGSFRASMKITSVNGTCSAFFFYHNDSQEIDIELLSAPRKQQTASTYIANLVLQSTQTLQVGLNAAENPGFLPYHLPFDPTAGFHEYRWDWMPDAVSFYADGQLLDTMTTLDDIPSTPGEIHLSHWSNGESTCPGGPPNSDAVLTIGYFKAYFNTSADTTAPPATCGQSGPNATCSVPDVIGAPDGNTSAHGAWFADGGDGKTWDGKGKATGTKKGAATRAFAGTGMLELFCVIAALAVVWWTL